MAGVRYVSVLLCCIAIMPERAYGLARGRVPVIRNWELRMAYFGAEVLGNVRQHRLYF